MGERVTKAVKDALGYNAFFLTAENITVSLLSSTDFQLRKLACDRIIQARRSTTLAKERKRKERYGYYYTGCH